MKRLALLLPLLLSSCTIIPTQHGTAQFWGDYVNLDFTDGGVHLHADTMTHSAVVRAHWHGASLLAADAAGGVLGMQGGTAALTAATSIIAGTQTINRPTSRPTPQALTAH